MAKSPPEVLNTTKASPTSSHSSRDVHDINILVAGMQFRSTISFAVSSAPETPAVFLMNARGVPKRTHRGVEASQHHIDKVFMENTKTWHAVLILWLEVLDAATDRGEFPVRGSPRSGNAKGGLEAGQ